MSTYQCCILMLFNDKLEIALTEMRNTTNIQELELRRHLLSLCTPKLRILNKLSKGKVRIKQFVYNKLFSFTHIFVANRALIMMISSHSTAILHRK